MAELECVDFDQASTFRAIPVGISHSNILPINREKVGKMNHVTLINPFEVPAGKEEQFVERWKQAAQYLRQREGFVSTRLHQSLDPHAKFRFINVAAWESVEHFQQAVGTPEFQELAGEMPFSSHPALYRVISE
jgi:heme oxygenase (mycobilin-producing)